MISRRGLLAGGAVTAAGALVGCAPDPSTATTAAPQSGSSVRDAASTSSRAGTPAGTRTGAVAAGTGTAAPRTEPFHGPHQAGVATEPQAHAVFLGFDLLQDTRKEALVRLLQLLTDDVARLTQGRPALADTEPELAANPARLTCTFGFGPGVFKVAGVDSPVSPLPRFATDRLDERWSGGDLLVQVCADDNVTVAHAVRMIVKDARSFARVRWVQRGFRSATRRNLMGQIEGTGNATDLDKAVWIGQGPLTGGTTLVLRRIRMALDTWDAVDRTAREFTIGRRLDTGAPLTGAAERDEPDYARKNRLGFPVISEYAHIRRAHVADPALRLLRRPYNFDDGLTSEGKPDSGLLFASYQADIDRQFVPIQRMLAEGDLLNEWITTIGSAIFAIPPGCTPGSWIGEPLLT
ncbi:Dyp-type peroxidase [Nonomuraea sp. NPDC004580]|uniref:Dyp-type peroxidase n=1 Tax=Nonomuraea sp. NPDC004580 TaxID=3154552 RepID=UPI0033BE159E